MAQSTGSTNCPEQLTTMSDLSNPNGNTRPQRKCTRSKRIYEDYEMTKITKPTTTRKRGGKQFKKSLLQVDIASSESERPSNVCVTQPNHSEVNIVSNLNNNAKILPSDKQIAEYLFLNELKIIGTVDSNNKIFPGYNLSLFLEFRNLLLEKNVDDFVNRNTGACNLKELYPVIVKNSWLNDLIIQHYFNLIKKNCNNNIFIGTTFFFPDLEKYGVDIFVERYLKNKDLLSYSKIVIPTHVVNHWVLIVAEISQKKIVYYDSLDYFSLIYPKIVMLKSLINEKYISKLKTYKYDSFITDICSGISPKQDNSSDCGIFTCTNARYNVCNKPSTFKQEDVPLLRQRIFYEMVCNKLLPTE